MSKVGSLWPKLTPEQMQEEYRNAFLNMSNREMLAREFPFSLYCCEKPEDRQIAEEIKEIDRFINSCNEFYKEQQEMDMLLQQQKLFLELRNQYNDGKLTEEQYKIEQQNALQQPYKAPEQSFNADISKIKAAINEWKKNIHFNKYPFLIEQVLNNPHASLLCIQEPNESNLNEALKKYKNATTINQYWSAHKAYQELYIQVNGLKNQPEDSD